MDNENLNVSAEPAPATAAVKSPSYSPQLDNRKLQSDPGDATSLDNADDVLSFDDFNDLLESLPSSTVTPIVNAYGHLLSLYHYSLDRLQLLELIGANGILTDALIIRLQQLNDENERLLQAERYKRDHLKELELQLDDQKRQTASAEAALHDAHQLLQQQEHELASQAQLISEVKDRYSERALHSHRTSDRSENHRTQHSSREGSNRDKDRERSREHRSHRSESRRHLDHDHEARRTDRASSVTSSRRSSSRRDDVDHAQAHRDYARIDRIHEDDENQHDMADRSPRTRGADAEELDDRTHRPSERRISINGTASRNVNGVGSEKASPSNNHNATKHPEDVDEDYEPEIDLGEDLQYEEVPTSVPLTSGPSAANAANRSRSRSRSPRRHRHEHSDSEHRSNHRARTRSPTRRDRGESDGSRQRDRRSVDKGEGESVNSSRRSADAPAGRRSQGEGDSRSSSNTNKNRNNMYGRLGLPLSGGHREGTRAQLAIKGAGRSSKR